MSSLQVINGITNTENSCVVFYSVPSSNDCYSTVFLQVQDMILKNKFCKERWNIKRQFSIIPQEEHKSNKRSRERTFQRTNELQDVGKYPWKKQCLWREEHRTYFRTLLGINFWSNIRHPPFFMNNLVSHR